MAVLTTGDDAQIEARLTKKGSSFAISAGATAKATLTALDRTLIISPIVELDMVAAGVDLGNSILVVKFTAAESAAITELGEVLLEIQVDDGGKLTWTRQITVRNGNIP